ncbi:hypothetical protein TNCV_3802841 [Trichonephila clavipes]|nr:hypothetical protein TNCV_3802841 [Trichonephila clavipes]
MVGNIFVRQWVTLFTRALEETDLYHRSHLGYHRSQSSIERFTNTELADVHMVYGLAEGNAQSTEILCGERYP